MDGDLNFPAFEPHRLKARLIGDIGPSTLPENYRLVFRFEDGEINEVEYVNITEAAEKLKITRPNLSAMTNGRAGISAVFINLTST